jgi:hypothetical protein
VNKIHDREIFISRICSFKQAPASDNRFCHCKMAQSAQVSTRGDPDGVPFGLIINNEDVSSSTSFDVLDPITKLVTHQAPAATDQQALDAVTSAAKAFETWRETTPIERRNIFNRAVEILRERTDEITAAMVSETGAKPSWAAFNIKTAIEIVMEGAGMATQVKGEILQSNSKGQICAKFFESSKDKRSSLM